MLWLCIICRAYVAEEMAGIVEINGVFRRFQQTQLHWCRETAENLGSGTDYGIDNCDNFVLLFFWWDDHEGLMCRSSYSILFACSLLWRMLSRSLTIYCYYYYYLLFLLCECLYLACKKQIVITHRSHRCKRKVFQFSVIYCLNLNWKDWHFHVFEVWLVTVVPL